MDALPQVGQKYQHSDLGEVKVTYVRKLGRGHRVVMEHGSDGFIMVSHETLKNFQKAIACKP